jgi:N-ethylmaleimide reductase
METLGPTKLTELYYAQRASKGGLLITEAVHISPEGTPVWSIYPVVSKEGGHVPGIWNKAQTEGWQKVVQGVHEKGGKICCQLLHAGRVVQPDIFDHPAIKNSGLPMPPVSSSTKPIAASGEEGNQYNWDQAAIPPRALETSEIARLVGDYKHAAQNAKSAGFDSVELHAAHGYLIEQFLADGVNDRTDCYGGSIANRCRLLFEVVEALLDVMGSGRVAVRLSPVTGESSQSYFGVTTSDAQELYSYAVGALNRYDLAYLLLTEPRVGGLSQSPEKEEAYTHPLRNKHFRSLYDGVLIGAGGFTPATGSDAVKNGAYDMIAYGRWFLSNPDLPDRIRSGADLNVYERKSFYGGDAQGYTDYPSLAEGDGRYRKMRQADIRDRLK